MAQVKYGAIVTEIKGKVGGQIFQGGRGAPVLKNKPATGLRRGGDLTNLHPPIQATSKLNFSIATKAWSQASQAERDSWANLVGTWQFVNKFGDVYDATAYQIFCACYMNTLAGGITPILTAPTYEAAFDPQISFTDYSLAGGLDRTIANANAIGQYVIISLSQIVHPTIAVSKLQFRQFNSTAIVGTGTTDISSGIDAYYGYTPPLGSAFYIKTLTFLTTYPKYAFVQLHKINVVA